MARWSDRACGTRWIRRLVKALQRAIFKSGIYLTVLGNFSKNEIKAKIKANIYDCVSCFASVDAIKGTCVGLALKKLASTVDQERRLAKTQNY